MGNEERPGPSNSPGARLDLQLHGSFDQAEASLLHAILARVAPLGPVRVDFHDVRTLHDVALSLLARDLAAPYGRNVELVGLSQHHHRLLRYIAPGAPWGGAAPRPRTASRSGGSAV